MSRKIKVGIGLVGALGLGSSCSYKGPISDHYDGREFFNPWERQQKSLVDVLKWKLKETPAKWPKSVANNPNPLIPAPYAQGNVAVTFVNHASFLITIGGLNILTDPVWSERTSPWQWIGPKRVREPGIAFDSLPKIDAVLVSHNHYDHLDLPTLKKLSARDQPKVFVPLGDKDWLTDEQVVKVEELDWWQTVELTQEVKIHFAPAQHWSSRSVNDTNKSLWGAFLIEYKGQALYIAGDTGYGPHFRYAADRFPNIALALLPIGAYEPRWFMKYAHMNPDDSLKAFVDLKAKAALAMHFGCWQLTDEGIDAPAIELRRQMKDPRYSQLKTEDRFLIPEEGATYRYQF